MIIDPSLTNDSRLPCPVQLPMKSRERCRRSRSVRTSEAARFDRFPGEPANPAAINIQGGVLSKIVAARKRTARYNTTLTQQLQHGLRNRVGLCQHGRTGLDQDLIPREVYDFAGHVHVADLGLG